MLSESILAEYCAAGSFEPGVARMKAALRERRDALVAAIDRHLGGRVSYIAPAGGYFLWARCRASTPTPWPMRPAPRACPW